MPRRSTSDPTSKDDSQIADRVRVLMALRKVKLRGLSELTGIPYHTLQSYLLARHTIPAPAVGKIAVALGSSADWLILGEPPRLDRIVLYAAISTTELVEKHLKTSFTAEQRAEHVESYFNAEYARVYRRSPEKEP